MTELATPSPPPEPPQGKQTPQPHLSATLLFFFSYLLFFSPSLLKLLSFLSPLFLTTSLLLLTLSHPSLTYQSLLAAFAPHDFDYSAKEALQVYNIVFDVGDQVLLVLQHHQHDHHVPVEEQDDDDDVKKTKEEEEEDTSTTTALIAGEPPPPPPPEEGSIITLATLFNQHHHEEEGKQVRAVVKSSKVGVGQREETDPLGGSKEKSVGGKATTTLTISDVKDEAASLGSYGSMRKEKEWRRTLACKLFEERHNADSSEGMDLLWETYEPDQSGNDDKNSTNGKATVKAAGKKSKSSKQWKTKGSSNKIGHHHYDDDDDHDYGYDVAREEEGGGDDGGGRLCCLQALKFSAGKMNLGGMGKPNLVKISKAIKGFGWLHGVTTSTRHPKTKKGTPLN